VHGTSAIVALTAQNTREVTTVFEAPLWICVLVQPSFDALRPAWSERAARAEALELAPLAAAAFAELCRTLRHPAENLPAQLVEMITARAQGNAMAIPRRSARGRASNPERHGGAGAHRLG
jgi:hypothetical protein